METLEHKIRRIVEENLTDGRAEIETLPNGHISGDYIASDFVGRTYADRRALLRQIFEDHLSPDEIAQISTMLTYTPEEWNAPVEGT